jgi:excisionase family DNA binding protein
MSNAEDRRPHWRSVLAWDGNIYMPGERIPPKPPPAPPAAPTLNLTIPGLAAAVAEQLQPVLAANHARLPPQKADPPPPPREVMDREQAAEYLQVCEKTIDRLVEKKLLRRCFVGRSVRFKRTDIDKMLSGPGEQALLALVTDDETSRLIDH